MPFAKNTQVRQIVPAPVEGVVTSYVVDQETGEVLHKVEWEDDTGWHSRFFKECEIESAS